VITFTTYGVPIPQGSTKAFYIPKLGRSVITNDNAKTKPWRHAIVAAAQEAVSGRAPLEDVALEVHVLFYLPRPASAPKRVTEPAKKPDVDKLLRALLDALTAAGVWRDDAQVIATFARKAFAAGVHDPMGAAGLPRAEVRVSQAAAPSLTRAQPSLLEASR
jgi:Holliday junction resolvase RusA-like endonuclease